MYCKTGFIVIEMSCKDDTKITKSICISSNIKRIAGGNKIDIPVKDAVKLVTSYWSQQQKEYEPPYVFVGDVHGDMHQFLAPLVLCGIIRLTGKIIKVKYSEYEECNMYIPEYELLDNPETTVIYLGDMIDEWICSREIVYMLYDLLVHSESVRYVFGNHDLNVIGRYKLWEAGKLNLRKDVANLYHTVKKGIRHFENINFVNKEVTYKGKDGSAFLHEYVRPIFEKLYKIFADDLGQLSIAVEIKDIPYIVSHCTWRVKSLLALCNFNMCRLWREKLNECDKSEIMQKPLLDGAVIDEDDVKCVNKYINKHPETLEEYEELSSACNNIFRAQSALFIAINNVTYTRIVDNIFLNQITGHTFGGEWKDAGINPDNSYTYEERINKLNPLIVNDKQIYYFDFACSAGYNVEEYSTPCFVYTVDDEFKISDLPTFVFVENGDSFSLRYSKSRKIHIDRTELPLNSRYKFKW